MTDRPIIFSAPMVRALLAGRKTMTRRLAWRASLVDTPGNVRARRVGHLFQQASPWQRVQPGDRLWVRETFWIAEKYSYGCSPSGEEINPPPLAHRSGDLVHFAAAGDPPNVSNRHYPGGLRDGSGAFAAPDPYAIWRLFPSIHMPRWASRLTLVVTAVRVERLQAISETDAQAEGMVFVNHGTGAYGRARDGWHSDSAEAAKGPDYCLSTARFAFANLWGSLHGAGSWAANPEVVALTFTVHQHNIDTTERAAA